MKMKMQMQGVKKNMTAMARAFTGMMMLLLLLFASTASASARARSSRGRVGCFSAIYSFGDSLADTGNLLKVLPPEAETPSPISKSPYGDTFFGTPTGRASDGCLVVDFLTQASAMPPLQSYLDFVDHGSSNSGGGGINFAVGGATALDSEDVVSKLHAGPMVAVSLTDQMDWFSRYKSDFCSTQRSQAGQRDCARHFQDALFLVGEIGGNDINYQFLNDASMDQVGASLGTVVARIEQFVRWLIDQGGAMNVMIQNNLPIGCSAAYLTAYPNEARDSMGCMPRFNHLVEDANALLLSMIMDLQSVYASRGVRIVHADMYGAAMKVLEAPHLFGISEPLKACCGDPSTPYRFNPSPSAVCGGGEGVLNVATKCNNPRQYFNWDGVHLTDKAYQSISALMFVGSYTLPSFRSAFCPSASLASPAPPPF